MIIEPMKFYGKKALIEYINTKIIQVHIFNINKFINDHLNSNLFAIFNFPYKIKINRFYSDRRHLGASTFKISIYEQESKYFTNLNIW